MNNKYKLYKESLEGKILRAVKYVAVDHQKSFGYAGLSLLSAGASYFYAIPEAIKELNGLTYMDPESPMIIPAVMGVIVAFGSFANAVRHRIMENEELKEAYARRYHAVMSAKERDIAQAEEDRKNAFFRDLERNQHHLDANEEEVSPKTR